MVHEGEPGRKEQKRRKVTTDPNGFIGKSAKY